MLRTCHSQAGASQWEAENPGVPHPLDVAARLDELRAMQDGWLDGDGIAPPHDGLDWLAGTFSRCYSGTVPLPRIYPTEEGGVRMEWDHNANVIILEIDLSARAGDWLWFDRNSDSYQERRLDLDDIANWQWMASEIGDKISERQ